MKQYRLLRSNKESGPYTADELIGLGLKPYDLVWMDGKSAAWRYPSEMQEFKALVPAVEEQPFDRFFKNQGPAKANSQPVVETAAVVAVAPKPRIRVKADWNRIEQPMVVAPMQAAAAPQPKPQQPAKQVAVIDAVKAVPNTVNNASWQNSWLDWQQEQDAVKNAAKTDAAKPAEKPKTVNTAHTEHIAPEIETKFSQSLDSLKQRYADTVLKTKGKAAEWYKFKGAATVALLAIPVLGFGIWLGSGMHNQAKEVAKPVVATVPVTTPAPETQQPPADNSNTAGVGVQGNTSQQNNAATRAKPNPNAKELVPSFDNDDNNNKPPVPVAATKPAKKAIVKQLPPPTTLAEKKYAKAVPQQKTVSAQPQQKYVFAPPANTNPSARSKVINPALVGASVNASGNPAAQNRQQEMPAQYAAAKKEPENANPVFAHYSKQQKVEDYVSVEADKPYQQAIQNLALNVENVTDATVDLVVIDVQYYDQGGRFKTGQTIYIKNIPVNETVRAKIPDNVNASRIKYRVSLVSVEQKGVYLVAE